MTQYTLEITTLNNNGTLTTEIETCTKNEIEEIKVGITNSLFYKSTLVLKFQDDSIYLPYEIVTKSIFKIFCDDDNTEETLKSD